LETKSKKILVADDDLAILDVMSTILEDKGYGVKKVDDGNVVEQAIEYLPDVILLDIWMSGMDGRIICENLKSNLKSRNIPVVLVSANSNIREILKNSKANDLLRKPFDIDELLEIVDKYSSQKL